MKHLVLASILSILVVVFSASSMADEQKKPTGWLSEAESDEKRFQLLQKYLRGFDQPMWEVGERYQSMHTALTRNNPELATYQWEKIRTTIENGIMKRPKRGKNAKAIFLETAWHDVLSDLKSGDLAKAKQGFNKAKAACMACHAAEQVGYMNNQPVFDLGFK